MGDGKGVDLPMLSWGIAVGQIPQAWGGASGTEPVQGWRRRFQGAQRCGWVEDGPQPDILGWSVMWQVEMTSQAGLVDADWAATYWLEDACSLVARAGVGHGRQSWSPKLSWWVDISQIPRHGREM